MGQGVDTSLYHNKRDEEEDIDAHDECQGKPVHARVESSFEVRLVVDVGEVDCGWHVGEDVGEDHRSHHFPSRCVP